MWIRVPAQIKSSALNRAWVTRWNRARRGILRAILLIMTPSCLRVESAIIFLRSHSANAFIPAINIVKVAVHSRRGWNACVWDNDG